MPRKKTDIENPPDAPPDAPVDTSQTPVETIPRGEPEGNGKPKPAVSYKLRIGTTMIEVAVWPNTIKSQFEEGEVTVYGVTIGRSYLTDKKEWIRQERPSFRTAELAGLLYLLQKASDWIYSTRVEDSSMPF